MSKKFKLINTLACPYILSKKNYENDKQAISLPSLRSGPLTPARRSGKVPAETELGAF